MQVVVGGVSLYLMRGNALSTLTSDDCVILPGWENPAAWQIRAEALCRGVACVGFYESTHHSHRLRHGVVSNIRAWFFRHLDCVLTVGESSRAAVLKMGVDPARIVCTHNSVDVDEPGCGAGGATPVADGTRRTRFVFVGQLIARKNVAVAIEALALCPESYTLSVIGEGPLAEKLVEIAARWRVADRVVFEGYVPPESLGEQLDLAGTLLLPSTEEVYGLAPAEALTVGLHAVVSRRAGIAADIQGMRGVWIVEPQAGPLAAAMMASNEAWSGPVADPEILQWSAQQTADDVISASEIAVAHRKSARHRSSLAP